MSATGMSVPAVEARSATRRTLNWPFVIVATAVHLGAAYAIFRHPSLAGWALAFIGLVALTWVGIGMTYHRLLMHQTFKVPRWLERILTTIGALNVQGGPVTWVSTHIRHHTDADGDKDPHSPRVGGWRGFWWAHIGWMIFRGQERVVRKHAKNLAQIRYYRFLEAGQLLFQVPIGVLLYLMGGSMFVYYGIFVRICLSWHVTFSVNSLCHMFGSQPHQSRDLARNNHVVNVLAGGEGLHNAHHDAPSSASNRRAWYDIDAIWLMIRALRGLGLATEVVEPRPR